MIYVIGSSKNNFISATFRKKFFIDETHDGANIDDKNPWYCELTGLYHMWKHCDDDIVGLEHYRRYFYEGDHILAEPEIRSLLTDCDILLRKFEFKKYGQRDGFYWLESEDKMKYLVEFLYQLNEPDFAMFVLHELETQPVMAQCNMFIAKREVMDKYCSWLFEKLEKLDFSKFKDSPRIMGYLTEYILFAWVKYNKIKYKFQNTITLNPQINRVIERTDK